MSSSPAMKRAAQLLCEARRRMSELDFAGAKAQCDEAIAVLRRPDMEPGGNSEEARMMSALYNDRGLALYKMVDFQAASENFSQAIRWDASLPCPYYHRGIVSYRMGRFDEAVEDLKQAVSRSDDSPRSQEFYRGLAEAQKQAMHGVPYNSESDGRDQ